MEVQASKKLFIRICMNFYLTNEKTAEHNDNKF